MLTSHIALLRGVNLGPAKRVAMADLRAIAEGLGHTGVRTLLNSGNLVFQAEPSADHAARLQAALLQTLSVKSRVLVLTADELAAVIAANPFPEEAALNPSRLLVTLPGTPEALGRLAPLADADWRPERLALGGPAAFSWHPDGLSSGKLAEALDRAGKGEVTARNWGTVLKLQGACAAMA